MALFTGHRADRNIKKLVTAVNQSNNDAYKEAINNLTNLGESALPYVYEAMDYVNEEARNGLTHVVSRLTDSSSLQSIVHQLEHSNPKVSNAVSNALIQTRKINPNALLEFLKDPAVPNNKLYVILGTREDELDAGRLISTAYDLEISDKDQIFKIVERIITQDQLNDLLGRATGKDPVIRAHIIRILAKFRDTKVVRTLEGLLNDKNAIVRKAALESLTKLGAAADIKSLCAMLEDNDIGVQEQAVEAISRLNHPDTAKHLLDVLKSENEYARRSAVEVLNDIGTVENMKQLLQAILDEDWWVRSRAADAMSKIGGPKVVDSVLGLIHDENEDLRRIAVEILVTTKDPRAEQQLIKALQDDDWWVRERAADALSEMGSGGAIPNLVKILGKNPKSDPIIIRAIGKLGNENNVAQIMPYAEKSDELVKVEALRAVIDLAGKDTVKHVVALLKDQANKTENMETKDVIRIGIQQLDRTYFNVLMEDGSPVDLPPLPTAPVEATGALAASTMLIDEKDVKKAIEEARPNLDIGKLNPGDVLENRYKYLKRIGKGAFGTVILMEDTAVGEQIILKFLNAHIAADSETMQRFVHELKFSRKITHNNVIRIFDFLNIQGVFAISMEYFPSKELSDVIRGEPIDSQRALKI
ncbi:MAG: HEAT repeat domain-containing protein, partial [Gammaproteobacteria bacterium]|nr:HEAT repeat domain-containing protein [Gammaproteobacteria bacterium]